MMRPKDLIAELQALSCDDQLAIAESLAENLGYMVIEDTVLADGSIAAPLPGEHYQAGYDAGLRHAARLATPIADVPSKPEPVRPFKPLSGEMQ